MPANPPPKFSPGWRFLPHDRWVLGIGLGAILVLAAIGESRMAVMVGVVTAQFFLFCNVFRVKTKLELVWVVLAPPVGLAMLAWGFSEWHAAAAMALAGVVMIVLEMRDPLYHGVGWKLLNPGLPEKWGDGENG